MISQAIKSRGTRSFKYCLNSDSSLEPASLIIIDRSADIFTPSSHSDASSPLLHRVLSTNSRMKIAYEFEKAKLDTDLSTILTNINNSSVSLLDIELNSTFLAQPLAPDFIPSEANFTMSGISSLPVQIVPSICCLPIGEPVTGIDESIDIQRDFSSVWRSFASDPEDIGRASLVEIFTRYITIEGGVLPPPKKRGLGAELLALAQALIASPGLTQPKSSHLKFNSKICDKYISLLSLSFAIIDSLQRSSAKQFKQFNESIRPWCASFEGRMFFEQRLMNEFIKNMNELAQNTTNAMNIAVLSELHFRLDSDNASISNAGKSHGKLKLVSSDNSPISKGSNQTISDHPCDIDHLIMSIAR